MRDFTTKIIFQALLNCFYYVGAFSETVGYGNRVTKFLDKATNSKEVSHGRELLLKSEPTGNSAVRLSRFASRLHSEHSSIVVAEFSHVTVKNPTNTILIEDLCMQVKIFIGLTAQAPLHSCFFFCFYLWALRLSSRYTADRASSYPDHQAVESLPYYVSLVVYGRLLPAA